ncbi:MAG: hypothetical protein ACOCW8_01440, partial [bacterium]
MKIRFLLGFIFIFTSTLLSGQSREFSGSTEEYPDELFEMLINLMSEEEEETLRLFFEQWEKDSLYSEEEKQNIVDISNQLLKQKARPKPHFYNYIVTLMGFKASTQPHESFLNWQKGLIGLLESKRVNLSRLNKYFENTISLVHENSLYSSSSVTWKSNNSNFRFKYRGDQLYVDFPELELTCYSKRDSIKIFETAGWLDLFNLVFHGNKGIVTWERAGIERNKTYAELGSFEIDLTRYKYTADSVYFTNKDFFDYPLMGVLNDEVRNIRSPENAQFPEFDSYKKNFILTNLYPNITYTGGLATKGARVIGTGSETADAFLKLFRNDTLRMKVASKYVVFREERVKAVKAAVVLYLGRDSLYHGNQEFLYNVKNEEVSIIKSDDFNSQSPYFDTYHNIDMYFDRLSWVTNQNQVYLTMSRGASIGQAAFQSINYFNNNQFTELQGIDPVHPLVELKKFSIAFRSNQFPATEFARYMGLPVYQIRHQLLKLSMLGYIYFNTESDRVEVKNKLFNTLDASIGKIDYDVMELVSNTRAPVPNAVLDLKTFDLNINGIPLIELSRIQQVQLAPRGGSITMKSDRSFQFDGSVQAGLFSCHGNNFFFSYPEFKINLQNIDSLSIKVITGEKDNFGLDVLADVKNIVRNITGELLIDDPENKSGVKDYPEYPVFKSRENSYVYYGDGVIQNGAYKRDDFYFQIFPFTFDSLDNFKKEALQLEGNFMSSGIFPPIEQTLFLQPDYSLGFTHVAPEGGLPLYGGKGTYHNRIVMSNQGLKGNGTIQYLTSSTYSQDFNFYPDSMNTEADRYIIKQQLAGTQYPAVENGKTYIHWLPGEDKMNAEKIEQNFRMFNDETILSGNLLLTPTGLTGHGTMDLTTAFLRSNLFDYNANSFSADTTDFNLRSLSSKNLTVSTKNAGALIDFDKREGNFISNDIYSFVEFPENKYIGYPDNFTWIMDNHELEFHSSQKFQKDLVPNTYKDDIDADDERLTGARYTSTHSQQDSLGFISPLAVYNYQSNVIKAEKVEYIRVADARVFPHEGKVTVETGANMLKMDSAVIEANNKTRYHSIHTASVKINTRDNYLGSGNYDYIDETGRVQIIHLSEIEVDTGLQTVATGDIIIDEDFTLSPYFAYQGKVKLFANDKYLTFEGGVKVMSDCETFQPDWLLFESQINPEEIYIPLFQQHRNINRTNIYSGIFMTHDSIHLYPAFFSQRKNYNDTYLAQAKGFLHYNKDSGIYVIGEREKIDNPALPGNSLEFRRFDCELDGSGKLDLGVDYGQVNVMTIGKIKTRIIPNQIELNVMIGL